MHTFQRQVVRLLLLFVLFNCFGLILPAILIQGFDALQTPLFLGVAHAQAQPVNAIPNDVNCNVPPVVCKSGALTSNETWQASKIYVITSDLTVGPGAILTIEAGTVVKFAYYCCDTRNLFIEGTLNVNGADGQKVYFTSLYDDALGGDTNNDGGNSQPGFNNWDNIVFKNGSHGTIKYAEIRYGDSGRGGAIRLEGSSPTLDHVTFKSSPWAAISALPTDAPTITNFAAQNVGFAGMEIRGGALTTNATWNQTGIVYIITNDFTVGNGATLTIAAGVVLKFAYFCCDQRNLFVEGTLNVNGTATQKVYFSSISDDAIGGDTNSDGGNSQPRAGNWDNIAFKNGSHGIINYAEIRYTGGGAINLDGSSPTLDHVTVKHGSWAAMSALPTDTPTITNFATEDVVLAGMEIRGGALTTDATWNQTAVVYIFTSNFTVGNAATLTISPGIVLKLLSVCCEARILTVEGTVNVNGTADQPIYFTSLRDDAIGGDTNNDTGATQPRAGDWGGIRFTAASKGNFTHAVIRYAGVARTSGALHIKDATVTIVNSVISNNVIGLFAEGATADVQMRRINTPANISKSGLYSNTEYDVFAKAGASVVANSNWWGSRSAQPKVSGDVTTEDRCSNEDCTSVVSPISIYLPLIRR